MLTDEFLGWMGVAAGAFTLLELVQMLHGRPPRRGIMRHVPIRRWHLAVGGGASVAAGLGLLLGNSLTTRVGLGVLVALIVLLMALEAAHWVGSQVPPED